MLSYISNFKNIKKTLNYIFLCLILFISYSTYIYIFPSAVYVTESTWQSNLIRAERYIFSNQENQCAIIGSSMAFRLDSKILNNDIYNLSFSGSSPATGLALIQKSRVIPRCLIIEINVLDLKANDNFINEIFDPILYPLKKYLPALQSKNRPANRFFIALQNTFGRTQAQRNNELIDHSILSKLVNIHAENYMHIDELKLVQIKENLKNLTLFHKTYPNTKLFFLEMPIDLRLQHMPFEKILIDNVNTYFPKNQYTWIVPPVNDEYHFTVDGIHLHAKSIEKFSQYINKALNNN